jgi:hypothetical protein
MKFNSNISKILTNKWVLNIISILAFLNVIGFMVMGNFNNVIFFIIIAILVRYFSKNMIIVLGIPLIIVNIFSLNNISSGLEGLENNSNNSNNSNKNLTETIDKLNDEKRRSEPAVPVVGSDSIQNTNNIVESKEVDASNVQSDEHFEVGRPKNGASKIDYASTIESAYDELNKVLGSDGIKSLTDDTQRLMKQQMELAKSMEGLAPIVEKMMPMASKMQEMMKSMDGGGMSNIMGMAQKMASGFNTK